MQQDIERKVMETKYFFQVHDQLSGITTKYVKVLCQKEIQEQRHFGLCSFYEQKSKIVSKQLFAFLIYSLQQFTFGDLQTL